jgi:hypothetical protein
MHHYNQNAQYIMTHCRVIIIGLSLNFWAFSFHKKYLISAFHFITMVISYLIFIDLFWMIILSCKKYFMLITWFLYFMYTFLYRGNYFYILYYDKWVCILHTDRVYILLDLVLFIKDCNLCSNYYISIQLFKIEFVKTWRQISARILLSVWKNPVIVIMMKT